MRQIKLSKDKKTKGKTRKRKKIRNGKEDKEGWHGEERQGKTRTERKRKAGRGRQVKAASEDEKGNYYSAEVNETDRKGYREGRWRRRKEREGGDGVAGGGGGQGGDIKGKRRTRKG